MFLSGNFALKPLQIGEIMSNNEITWESSEKKADEKTTLFQDGICYDCDIAWCFWKNASWDTIRSSSGPYLWLQITARRLPNCLLFTYETEEIFYIVNSFKIFCPFWLAPTNHLANSSSPAGAHHIWKNWCRQWYNYYCYSINQAHYQAWQPSCLFTN